jgi:hypothetical protein
MAPVADPETYLRRSCERSLLGETHRGGPMEWADIAVVGRAFIAAGLLKEADVRSVLDEYALALSLRDGFHAMSVTPAANRSRLSSQRVVLCHLELADDDQGMTVDRIIFADDATHLEMSGADDSHLRGAPMWLAANRGLMRMGPRGRGRAARLVLIVADDQGNSASASSAGGSSSGNRWRSRFTTDVALAASTAWIDLNGTRFELPGSPPPAEVRIEALEAVDALRSMLEKELLPGRHDEARLDTAVDALVATGALRRDDPIVVELERVAEALATGRVTPGLPPPWDALLHRVSKDDGPVGEMAIGAAIDSLDGYAIRFDALRSDAYSFAIDLAVSPSDALLWGFPRFGLEGRPITWWAMDDRDNVYLATTGNGSGSGDVAEGEINSLSPLDPTATVLRLLPTGPDHRAVVTVPLVEITERR